MKSPRHSSKGRSIWAAPGGRPDDWDFAIYKYTDERYEPCILPNGSFTETPEESLDCPAKVCLHSW